LFINKVSHAQSRFLTKFFINLVANVIAHQLKLVDILLAVRHSLNFFLVDHIVLLLFIPMLSQANILKVPLNVRFAEWRRGTSWT
jgi:hypothetical protein